MTNKEAQNLIARNRSVFQHDTEMLEALDIAIKALEERPKGKWIEDKEHTSNPLLRYRCNKCGVYHSPTNYCPNCGKDMRGDV